MAKFLIIRLSSIGDIVLTTPVIRCLKNQVEGAEVHYLTKEQYSGILSSNPYVDRLWTYNDNMKELIEELKNEGFDFVIDLHHNLRSLRIKKALKTLSFSFNKLNFKKWLIVNFKINRLPDIHIVDRYMATLKHFNVSNDMKGLDYFPSPATSPDSAFRFPEIPENYIVLVIGAQHETKKAGPVKLAEICDMIEFPIVICGGKNDTPLAEGIMQNLIKNQNVTDATGKLSLDQSAELVKNSELVISHDTGLMHIAAAYKKKIISLWGNTIPEFGMYPYLADPQSKIAEVKGLSCRPCSKIGHQACPKKHFKCMNEQDSYKIALWANALAKSELITEE